MKLGKSKLALAKVINENGGWPERALWAVQDNCIAFFLGGKPEYKSGDRCWYSNSIDGACVGTITRDEKVTNWHQTVLSREEYYHSNPKADADGWIEWKGGERPTSGWVDFKRANGIVYVHTMAEWLDWGGRDERCGIVAYRQHKPDFKPEPCESGTRSIPELGSIDELCAKVTEENKHQHVDAEPTIEQLAQDYRNKLDFANSKQHEADDAKVAADAALGELERAGEALGMLILIAKQEPEREFVVNEWRDLQVGDIIKAVPYSDGDNTRYPGGWGTVNIGKEFAVLHIHEDGGISIDSDNPMTPTEETDIGVAFKFIRRP